MKSPLPPFGKGGELKSALKPIGGGGGDVTCWTGGGEGDISRQFGSQKCQEEEESLTPVVLADDDEVTTMYAGATRAWSFSRARRFKGHKPSHRNEAEQAGL
jgi:hypothetical protein